MPGDQRGVQEDLDQQMAENAGAKAGVVAQRPSGRHGQFQRRLRERPRRVELGVVAEVLHDAPGDGRRAGVGGRRSLRKGLGAFPPHPQLAIDDGEPVGHGRPGDEIGVIEKRQGVCEIIHQKGRQRLWVALTSRQRAAETLARRQCHPMQ